MISTSGYNRNGTNQSQRLSDALSPDYFLLEERSIADLLAFAKKHAAQLNYYNHHNTLEGNWSAFLDGNPKEMAAFLQDPNFFDVYPEKKSKYSRPHLVLFLVFLKLLQKSHAWINGLTKKQLDYYYREALGFATKKATPDQVHILARLSGEQEQLLIPKGTFLQAGEDGQGNPIQYKTDQDLLANQGKVARLMSLFVEKEVLDISRLRQLGEEKLDRGFFSILQLVYRKPGTANSPRNYPNNLETEDPLGQKILEELDQLETTITQNLHLRIAGFQRLMQDYHLWNNEKTWAIINNFLLVTYNERNNTTADLSIFKDPRDFDKNFLLALGFDVKGLKKDRSNVFDGIPDVSNLYDLHEGYLRSTMDEKILNFVTSHFQQSIEAFKEFMDARNKSLGFMKSIHQYLRASASKIGFTSKPWNHYAYKKDSTLSEAFAKLLGVTLIKKDELFIPYEKQLIAIQTYFGMKVEDYFFIRKLYLKENFPTVPDWKWERADSLLTQAYQQYYSRINPESKGSKNPEISRWKNLYQAPDATKLLVTATTKEEPHPRWKTFGAKPIQEDPKTHFAANIGWGISSPSLALSEGIRELSLSFTFEKEKFKAQRTTLKQYLKTWTTRSQKKGPHPFRIEISTEKEWLTLTDWASFEIMANQPVMKIVVVASEDLAPFAPLADDTNTAPWPTLRLILPKQDLIYKDTQEKEHRKQVYELFNNQSLEKLDLAIYVKGLKKLQIQNKEGSIDSKKPFDIFGTSPELGDSLFITHPELAMQKLDDLSIHLEWKNLPKEGLETYYKPYVTHGKKLGIPAINQKSFQVNLSLLEANHKMPLPAKASKPHALFPDQAKDIQTISPNNIPDQFPNNGKAYIRQSQIKLKQEVIKSDRYLEMELQPQDFLHNRYNALLQKIVNDSYTKANTSDPPKLVPLDFVPEPFKPTLKSITIDYKSSLEIDWKEGEKSKEDIAVQIEPFGQHLLDINKGPVSFFSDFAAEGTLFIGLENLQPPQSISFLFQLAAGSADPDLSPSKIKWSFLSNNVWKDFEKEQLLQDTTQGLLSSGLIQFFIPEEASLDHQRMPAGLYWIRAQVDRFTESLSDCIAIRTQAVSATWIDPGQASDHLQQPLSPESIRQPVEPITGLTSIQQPYSSFQGKTAEADKQLYRRASARLRHKQRALSMWDYENLVLEEFPDIYKVKAISADLWGDDYEPGSVRVVVVPDIRKRKPFDPFEPKVPVIRLREIQHFLQKRAPTFARIQVQNPRFWYLQLRIAVRFHDMNNFGFYAKQLEQELLEYLAPWAFNKSVDILFGGKVYPSVIVNFIENRIYVDYIDKPGIELLEKKADGSVRVLEKPPISDKGLLLIEEPDVIIASARHHYIEYLALPEESITRIREGIGFAKIEYDFRIK